MKELLIGFLFIFFILFIIYILGIIRVKLERKNIKFYKIIEIFNEGVYFFDKGLSICAIIGLGIICLYGIGSIILLFF